MTKPVYYYAWLALVAAVALAPQGAAGGRCARTTVECDVLVAPPPALACVRARAAMTPGKVACRARKSNRDLSRPGSRGGEGGELTRARARSCACALNRAHRPPAPQTPPTPPAKKPENETKLYCTDKWPARARDPNSTYISVRMQFESKGATKCRVRSPGQAHTPRARWRRPPASPA